MGALLLPLDEPEAVFGLQYNLLSSKVNYRFSSNRKIKQSFEFNAARQALCIKNKWISLYIKSNCLGVSRLGIIVSKRIINKAVHRNATKRMIRETFRLSNLSNKAVDIVVCIRKNDPTKSKSYEALIELFAQV